MLTPSHGILAYWFNYLVNRQLGTKVSYIYIVAGAVMPDLFHISHWVLENVFSLRRAPPVLLDLARLLHSFPVFAIVFTICFFLIFLFRNGFFYGRTISFFLGWGFFHIFIDVLTHKSEGVPYFWPWSNFHLYGLIDHYHPLMWVVEVIVMLSIFIPFFNHHRKN